MTNRIYLADCITHIYILWIESCYVIQQYVLPSQIQELGTGDWQSIYIIWYYVNNNEISDVLE